MENDPEARFASVRDFAAQLLPFAPEAIQQQWGDYFERDEAPPPSIEAQASTLGTEATQELLAPTVAESALQPTLQGTFAAARTAPPPSPRTRWLGLAVLGAGAAVTVWFFATRPPAAPEGAAAAESSPSQSSPHERSTNRRSCRGGTAGRGAEGSGRRCGLSRADAKAPAHRAACGTSPTTDCATLHFFARRFTATVVGAAETGSAAEQTRFDD